MYNLDRFTVVEDPPTLSRNIIAEFGSRITGISYRDHDNALIVHFVDQFLPADETALDNVLNAYDPVIISAERDGDAITVTLSKPRNLDGATALNLTVDGTPLPEATTLTDNAATVFIESIDEITIGIVEAYPHMEATI